MFFDVSHESIKELVILRREFVTLEKLQPLNWHQPFVRALDRISYPSREKSVQSITRVLQGIFMGLDFR